MITCTHCPVCLADVNPLTESVKTISDFTVKEWLLFHCVEGHEWTTEVRYPYVVTTKIPHKVKGDDDVQRWYNRVSKD